MINNLRISPHGAHALNGAHDLHGMHACIAVVFCTDVYGMHAERKLEVYCGGKVKGWGDFYCCCGKKQHFKYICIEHSR